MAERIDLTGQQFGDRVIVRNYCIDEDWIKINKPVPNAKNKYRLGKCLNCGRLIPTLIRKGFNPKRCSFCSNIGNFYKLETDVNEWEINNDIAICKIAYDNRIYEAIIDVDFYESAKQHIWRISKKRNNLYVITGCPKNQTAIYLHQFVLGKVEQGLEIDHFDGNGLNNRRSNLRAVTHEQNVDNMKKIRVDNKLGIRGVAYDKNGDVYCVDFSYHNTRIYFKPFKKIEEAVYCRKCVEAVFGLTLIINNSIAQQYDTLNNDKKDEIKKYVHDKIRQTIYSNYLDNQYAEKIS